LVQLVVQALQVLQVKQEALVPQDLQDQQVELDKQVLLVKLVVQELQAL
jgi:hypothetical protein